MRAPFFIFLILCLIHLERLRKMRESNSKLQYLNLKCTQALSELETEVLSIQCQNHKISSLPVVQILQYILPKVKQTTRVPTILVDWIMDDGILKSNSRNKYLNKIPEEQRKKYQKYKVGREIKVRYRFRNETKRYQEMRLAINYNKALYKYLGKQGLLCM